MLYLVFQTLLIMEITSGNSADNDGGVKRFIGDLISKNKKEQQHIFFLSGGYGLEFEILDYVYDKGLRVTYLRLDNNNGKDPEMTLNVVEAVDLMIKTFSKTSAVLVVCLCDAETSWSLLKNLEKQPIAFPAVHQWMFVIPKTIRIEETIPGSTEETDVTYFVPDTDDWLLVRSYRTVYNVTRKRHVLRYYGVWRPSGFTKKTGVVWQRTNGDMKGRTINIALEKHFPFFVPSEDYIKPPKGADIDLLNFLQKALNFRYAVVRPADGKWGSCSNGTWDGMIGMIRKQETYAAMGGTTVTSSRHEVVKFTTPYAYDRTTFVIKAPGELSRAWVIFRPYDTGDWVSVIGVILFVGVSLGLAEKFIQKYLKRTNTVSLRKKKKTAVLFYDALWNSFRSFLLKECYVPHHPAVRIIVTSYMVFAAFVITHYNGTLIGFMINPGITDPVDTIDKLVTAIKERRFDCGTIKDSSDHNIFKHGDSENFKIILNNMESNPKKNFVLDDKTGIHEADSRNYAYVGGQLTVAADIEVPEDYQFAKDSFQISGYAIALQKGDRHVEEFNRVILRLREQGFIDKWIKGYIDSVRNYTARQDSREQRKLYLTDLQGAFYLLAMGFLISSCSLAYEKWQHRKERAFAKANVIKFQAIVRKNMHQRAIVKCTC